MTKTRVFKSRWQAALPWAVSVPNSLSDFPVAFFATWEEARDFAFGAGR